MMRLEEIERALDGIEQAPGAVHERLLALAEQALEAWIRAQGDAPTFATREGFRLLALHHQGARGVPSFNACRETCREIAYHYNVIAGEPPPAERARAISMMVLLVRHLALFVGGKLQVAGLGDFCCASRPVRAQAANMAQEANVGERHA